MPLAAVAVAFAPGFPVMVGKETPSTRSFSATATKTVARPSSVRARKAAPALRSAPGKHRLIILADGLLAICIQHEMDHLDGILFVDYISPLKRGMILRKLSKSKKQNIVTV